MKDDQWVDAVMVKNQKKFIHVNQGNIKGNLKQEEQVGTKN